MFSLLRGGHLRAGAALPGPVRGRPVVGVRRARNRSRTATFLPAARGAEAGDAIRGMTARARAGLPATRERGTAGGTT
ncbi:hypothetical protein ACWGLP_33975 [Streptomyces lydicus]